MNPRSSPLSRRDFLRTAGWSAGAAALALRTRGADADADAPSSRTNPILVFSKPFQELGPDETADLVAKIGWNGIECPVRAKGQIEPAQVKERLPRYVEAFHRRNLQIPVLVTDIVSARQPHAEEVLRAAAALGIRQIRLGFWKYDLSRPILPQVAQVGADLREIGQLCGELGIRAGVENHSGAQMFGAPIWDIVEAIRGSQARNVGVFFDIGHATIEGGLSWPIQAQLARPYFTTVYVKDFTWKKEGPRWRMRWCPLGEGMIDSSFVTRLPRTGFTGPICQHHEYPLGSGDAMLEHFRRDLHTLKSWLAA